MIRSTTTFLLVLLSVIASAQNLVVNPGFEDCKKGLPVVPSDPFTSYGVSGWYMPTEGTTDWYHNVDDDSNPMPAGYRTRYWLGKVDPHSGHCFIGLGLFMNSDQSGNVTEYAGGTLSKSLTAGHTYTFSFWIYFAPQSSMYVDNVQVNFSTAKGNSKGRKQLKLNPQITIKIDTTRKWTLVQGEFVASGGEEYFTIGNFNSNFEQSGKYLSSHRRVLENDAYYYIDDVSLTDKNPSGPISISAGQKLVYNNILFDVGKSTITKSSYAQLDQIVAAMKKQSNLKVQISGHTDSDGDAITNQTLSEQRAVAVRNYFISKGIDSTRITTNGFGSSQPIGKDKSKNRRVEFVFSE